MGDPAEENDPPPESVDRLIERGTAVNHFVQIINKSTCDLGIGGELKTTVDVMSSVDLV